MTGIVGIQFLSDYPSIKSDWSLH